MTPELHVRPARHELPVVANAHVAAYRSRMCPLIREWAFARHRVAIFGIGGHTDLLFRILPELDGLDIVAFLDTNPDRHGSEYRGVIVRPLAWASTGADVILCSSYEHEVERMELLDRVPIKAVFSHRPQRAVQASSLPSPPVLDESVFADIVRREVRTALIEVPRQVPTCPRQVNYERMAYVTAAQEAAHYLATEMQGAVDRVTNAALRDHALQSCTVAGLVLEFGVGSGRSLTQIASLVSQDVHGFDSVEGLPEDWTYFQKKGRYSQHGELPVSGVPHVHLHKGLFHETLPSFLATVRGPARFVHIDCDLYSSTDTVLRLLEGRLVTGSVIVFDEYLNYPGWRQHEYKAFGECVGRTGLRHRYLAFASSECGVAVQIL